MMRPCRMMLPAAIAATAALSGCATDDRKSLLVADGDEALSCSALHQAHEDAGRLGDNAPARRRWLAQLISEKDCRPLRKISLSIGASYSFD